MTRRRNPRTTLMLALSLGGGLALLFWMKLRVVTGVPRTAYAEPAQETRP